MAKIVAAAGVPHIPFLPAQVANAPNQLPAEGLMREVRQRLEKAEPDVIFVFTADHFNTFFYNNMPAFCVGIVDEAEAADETNCVMPRYTVPGHRLMAAAFHRWGLKSNFDLASAQEIKLDHSIMVPLYFLTPGMNIPIIPIYTCGLAPPSPSARRCYSLGRMVKRFVEEWGGNERVALLASGSVSLEVGGPRSIDFVDEPWLNTVTRLLKQGNYQNLARRATEERMLKAGNVAQELLNWIILTGALDESTLDFLETILGSIYAAWDLEETR